MILKVFSKDLRAIIYDLGRVLIEYDHQCTLASVAMISKANVKELGAWFTSIQYPLGTGKIGALTLHQHWQQQFSTTADYAHFERAFCAGIARNEEALQYVVDLAARSQVRIGIISNTNAVHSGWLHCLVPEFRQFDSVILSDEVGLLKPEAAIYHLALQQLGVEAVQALFIDDLSENVAGAKAVGMAGIVHEDWGATRRLLEEWLFNDRP